MDPFAAVAIAGNILQFVQTVNRLTSTAKQTFATGKITEYAELKVVTQELQAFVERLTIPSSQTQGPGIYVEPALQSLGSQCLEITNELLTVLDRLRLSKERNVLQSLSTAFRAEMKRDQIESLRKRTDQIVNNLNIHLNASGQRRLISRLDELIATNRLLEANREDEITLLKRDFKRLLHTIGFEEYENYSGVASSTLLRVADMGVQYTTEFQILEQLRFDSIDDRFEVVSSAHGDTLAWVFGDSRASQAQRASTDFADWLSSESDLYWISGKPGSGKSTLMKYLCTSERTVEGLNKWAEDHELITANFFFWNASPNPLQKSHEGLLRTLIYQILRQRPEIIKDVYSELWNASSMNLHTTGVTRTNYDCTVVSRHVSSLLSTIQRLTARLAESNVRCCFFIDGMDEYDGNLDDIVSCIGYLRQLPKVKICVSSRPWNEFESAFGQSLSTKLYMQDFNYDDIYKYVQDNLEKTIEFQDMEEKDTEGKELLQELIEAAKGVFLWVVLVVKSMKEGLVNGDSVHVLTQRLRSFPTRLNDFFRTILESHVSDFYRQNAAQWFSVTFNAKSALSLIALWFLDHEGPAYAVNLPIEPLTIEQTRKRQKDMRKRLNASCKGLLEVHVRKNMYSSLETSPYFNLEVGFLHRTVKEFLEEQETQELLRSWEDSKFNYNRAICVAVLSQIKSAPRDIEYAGVDGPMTELFDLFFKHIKQLEEQGQLQEQEQNLLDSLARTIKVHEAAMGETIYQGMFTKLIGAFIHGYEDPKLLDLCARFGLNGYVTQKLDSQHPATMRSPLLLSMMTLNVELVRNILSAGANPNAQHDTKKSEETVWSVFYHELFSRKSGDGYVHGYRVKNDPIKAEYLLEIISMCLDYGANATCTIQMPNGKSSPCLQVIEMLLPYEKYLIIKKKAQREQKSLSKFSVQIMFKNLRWKLYKNHKTATV